MFTKSAGAPYTSPHSKYRKYIAFALVASLGCLAVGLFGHGFSSDNVPDLETKFEHVTVLRKLDEGDHESNMGIVIKGVRF